MRRKLFLALSSRAPLGGVSTGSPVTQMNAENPHSRGWIFLKYERSSAVQRTRHYDTFRYLPTSERSLLPFFGGPVDISFSNSV